MPYSVPFCPLGGLKILFAILTHFVQSKGLSPFRGKIKDEGIVALSVCTISAYSKGFFKMLPQRKKLEEGEKLLL